MTTQEQVETLATMTNRDDAGRHFTERYADAILDELEAGGLIAIDRPVHQPTGLPWGREHWTLEVTPEGVGQVEAHPEYHPARD
jgi:hypothetical protein